MTFYNDNFTSSDLEKFCFSCPIAVARTSNPLLNRSGESGHPCLLPDFSRKAFCVLALSIMLTMGLS